MSPINDDSAVQARKMAVRRERHWTMLLVATSVVILSFALRVRDDQRVELRFCPGYPMPETCFSRTWFNTECPGCGLTRSFIFLASGDWRTSLSTHRIGWLMALAILAQFPYRWFSLCTPTRTTSPRWARWFGWLLIVSLIGNWVFNLIL